MSDTMEQGALLALTPDRYLAAGFFTSDGSLRAELRSEYATAACAQLFAAEASPQELSFTLEAIRQILPTRSDPDITDRLVGTMDEAFGLVARTLQKTNNQGVVDWLSGCAAAVRTEADLDGFLAHAQSVERQYSLLAALPPLGSSPS